MAKDLLGGVLVHRTRAGTTSGLIVETEAYLGQADPGSHAYRGQTERNAVMFGPAGRAYVYFTYGRHYCFNVVCGPVGQAQAVLIRALEPVSGLKLMSNRRKTIDQRQLCNGPAKLTQAMGISRQHNRISLLGSQLFIKSLRVNISSQQIVTTPRIGLSHGVNRPYRFYLRGNVWISRR